MKLHSTRLGELEVNEQQYITFRQGLPGFEGERRFYFVQPDGHYPLSYMQAADDSALSFIVVNPFLFYQDYQFELNKVVKEELAIQKEADVQVFSLLSVRESLQSATLNLLAPLVINPNAKQGKQIVLHQSGYHTRHPLMHNAPRTAAGGKG